MRRDSRGALNAAGSSRRFGAQEAFEQDLCEVIGEIRTLLRCFVAHAAQNAVLAAGLRRRGQLGVSCL